MFIEIEDYKTDRDQKRRSNDQSSFDASDVTYRYTTIQKDICEPLPCKRFKN